MLEAGHSAKRCIIQYRESSNSAARFCHVNLKPYPVTRQKLIDRALDCYLPKARVSGNSSAEVMKLTTPKLRIDPSSADGRLIRTP